MATPTATLNETVSVTDLARVGKGISQDFTAVVAGSSFYGV